MGGNREWHRWARRTNAATLMFTSTIVAMGAAAMGELIVGWTIAAIIYAYGLYELWWARRL